MKRTVLLFGALVLALASRAQAQLTMQMSNGWSFTFAGNVNAFIDYEKPSSSGTTSTPFGLIPAGSGGATPTSAFQQTRIQTGLLPAFAVFEAKGKEGNTDLTVHFGFAPQINCASGVHDCFGAQIDMRQVFLTFGGSWGQILAGRELGLWGRQNILNDQTLFGIGATGAGGSGTGGGTTLGRIGFGYIYPQFKAQMTYSTKAGRPGQLSIGLFEAASNGDYHEPNLPRVEAEATWSQGNIKAWAGGLVQSTKNVGATATGDKSATATGGSGGIRYGSKTWSVVGSGYFGKGVGTTLLANGGSCQVITADTDNDVNTPEVPVANLTCGTNSSADLRTSYGFIGQITVTPANSKATIAGSYGSSYLKASTTDKNVTAANAGIGDFRTENTLISGGIYYQATKSLKVVLEGNYAWTKGKKTATANLNKNKSFVPAFGFMLFF